MNRSLLTFEPAGRDVSAVRTKNFPSWPQLGPQEVDAAAAVLLTNELSQNSGRHVATFEEAYAQWHSAPHAIAVNNGTSAIHLALAALGIGPGDEVLVPAYTFVGSASPIAYLGATPVFVDIDPDTFCIDPADAEAKISERTKAVIAVHLNGYPAPVGQLAEMARRHGIKLVEDTAQGHGAEVDGRRVGTIGDVGTFSFWQDKTMTTGGEGGALLTADADLAASLRMLRDHGLVPAGPGLFHHAAVGYNYRLTSPQAAVGLVQLGRLDGFVAARRRNGALLDEGLAQLPGLSLPKVVPGGVAAPWKYTLRLTTDPSVLDVVTLVSELQQAGIPAQRRYPIPLTRQPIFAGNPSNETCPNSDLCASTAFCLPVHPAAGPEDIQDCVDALAKVLSDHAVSAA
ncbi:DegT/DnrJ/EryC1/StrS family aminotransferase [Streptomyces sp. CBMA123]|uniref:DegT/DnrJ/EryC1/StrS family aminotransferase n=1 Tax=Streptomyces sp. CBMA123 TaxID=1896313 RepID=UPI0016619F95|nr:DegT/DnrJ/EryC1/StrS family aminotransferase [Streptomyces sp. CBMA123]